MTIENSEISFFKGSLDRIISLQRKDGSITWFENGIFDPWNHLESVMALNIFQYEEEKEINLPKDPKRLEHVVHIAKVARLWSAHELSFGLRFSQSFITHCYIWQNFYGTYSNRYSSDWRSSLRQYPRGNQTRH